MTAQIQQVLLSYWRHGTSGVGTFVGVLALFVFVVVIPSALQANHTSLYCYAAMLGALLIGFHLKQQATQTRERCFPGAFVPHIGVGVTLVFIVGLGIPMVRMAVTGVWNWGFPGLCMATSGLTLLGCVSQSQFFSIVFIVPPLVNFSSRGKAWIAAVGAGEFETIGMLLMTAGFGSIVATVYWLRTATEEDRGYYSQFPNRQNDFYRRDPVESEQSESAKEFWRRRRLGASDPTARTVANWPALGRGSFIQQWRLWEWGRRNYVGLVMAFIFPFIFIGMQLYMKSEVDLSQVGTNPFLIFPGYMLLQIRLQARGLWVGEFLRPVERSKFFAFAAMGIFVWTFAYWMITLGICIAANLIVSPHTLTAEAAVRFAAIVTIAQCWLVAVGIWCTRYRSMFALVPSFTVAMLGVIVFGTANAAFKRSAAFSTPMLGVYLAFTIVICAVILVDAYRRWLRVELG